MTFSVLTKRPGVFRSPVMRPSGVASLGDPVTFQALAGDSKLGNLPTSITVNGETVAALCVFEGKNASTSTWTATVGTSAPISGAGADPSVGRDTPFTDATDKSVLFNNAKLYVCSAATQGDLGTDDFVMEFVYRQQTGTSTNSIYRKKAGAGAGFGGLPGWSWTVGAANSNTLAVSDGVSIISSAVTAARGVWHHTMWFVDRDEASTNGMAACVDGVLLGGTDASAFSAVALDVANAMGFGQAASNDICYIAIYKRASWFAGGATNATQWTACALDRMNRMAGLYPQVALGTPAPTAASRSTNAYLDRAMTAPVRKLFLVGSNWLRMCSRTEGAGGETLKGLLIEEQRTNRFVQSQTFENASWTKVNSAVTANSIAAPDDDITADSLIADATATQHAVSQAPTLSAATHTMSVWVKAGDRSFCYLENATIANGQVWFDIVNGTVGTQQAGIIEARCRSYGNGWFRVWASFTGTAAAHTIRLSSASADNTTTFTGDAATVSTYLWGAQVEANETVSSYIPTITTVLTRTLDTLQYKMDDGNFLVGSPGSLTAQVLYDNRNFAGTHTFANMSASLSSVADSVRIETTSADVARAVLNIGGSSEYDITGTTDIVDGEIHEVKTTYQGSLGILKVDSNSEGAPDLSVSLLAAAPPVLTVGMFNSVNTTDALISNVTVKKRAV